MDKKELIGLGLFIVGLLMLAHNPILTITGNAVLANSIHAGLWFYLFAVFVSFAGLVLILTAKRAIPQQYEHLEELIKNKDYTGIRNDISALSLVPETGRSHKEHLPGGSSTSHYLPNYSENDIQRFEKRVIKEGRGEVYHDKLVFYGLSDRGPTGTVRGELVNAIRVVVKEEKDKYGRKKLHYYGEPLHSTDIPADVRNIKGMPLADVYNAMKMAGYNLPPKVKGKNELERFEKSNWGISIKTHEQQFMDNSGRLWSIDRTHIPPHFDRLDPSTGTYDIVSSAGTVLHTKTSRTKKHP